MYLAADIGGTNGRVAAYAGPEALEPLVVREFKLDRQKIISNDLLNLEVTCRGLMDSFGSIEGVGLAVAGKVNSNRSSLVMAGNLGHWVGEPFVSRLRRELGCHVVLGNDAEAAALAEDHFGVGSQDGFRGENLLAMIWGTGIGGAAVLYGAAGDPVTVPGEPGHIGISTDEAVRCGCGGYGHLEAYCGGANIPARLGKSAEELDSDEWQQVLQCMILGLENVLRVLPVGLVTFSGGVACKQSWLMEELESAFDRPEFGSPKFRISAFGETAGTLGALSLLSLP